MKVSLSSLFLLALPSVLPAAGLSEDFGKANGAVPPGWSLLSAVEVPSSNGEALPRLEAYELMRASTQRGTWMYVPKPGAARDRDLAQWRLDKGRLTATPGITAGVSGTGSAGRAAIVAYTIPPGQAGFYALTESMLQSPKGKAGDRFDLRVFVRHAGWTEDRQPEPAVWTGLDAGQSFDFDTFLGYLDAGDTVYVSISPAGAAAGDRAELDFRVTRTTTIPISVFPEDLLSKTALKTAAAWTLVNDAPAGSAAVRFLAGNGAGKAFQLGASGAKVQLEGAQKAIAAFRVPQSGYYALSDAWAAPSGEAAVTAQVYAGNDTAPRRQVALAAKGPRASLNTDLGYVEQGDVIWVAFTSAEGSTGPASVDFGATVVEWAPRRAPLRVQRGEDGYLDVYESSAPRTAVDIPADRWITVPAQEGDATDAIRKAFADAQAAQKGNDYVGIRLEAGKTYTVASKQAGGEVFDIRDTQRVIFDGNGAKLVINSPEFSWKIIDLFGLRNSSRMVFADMTVEDNGTEPFIVGEILDVNPPKGNQQTVTFRLEAGYLDPLELRKDGQGDGYAYDPNIPGRLGVGTWSHFPAFGKPAISATGTPGEYTHAVTRTGGSIRPGFKWLIKNKVAGVVYLVTRGRSEDVTLWKIDGRASGGGILRNWATPAINVLDSRFEPTDDRWISSSADGIHGRGREGVWVENTVIRGICEDIMNTYGETMAVESDGNNTDNVMSIRLFTRANDAPSGRALRMPGNDAIRVGDRLLFFNPKNGQVLGFANVTAIADGRYTLSNPIPDVDTWEEKDGKGATMVYNTESAARFFVRDSRFLDGMRIGIYIKAQGGVIFNNHFEGLSAQAIAAANEPEWPEGPPATHLWIQGNTFNQNNYSYMSLHRDFIVVDPADISIYTRHLRDPSGPGGYAGLLTRGQRANSHVRIVGNTFLDWRGMGISVRNAANVFIADNVFLPPMNDEILRETLSKDQALKGGYAAIFLDSVDGARLMGNRFYGLPKGDQSVVFDQDVKDVVQANNVSSGFDPLNLEVVLAFQEWFGTSSADSAPSGAVKDEAKLRGATRQSGIIGAGVAFDGKDDLVVLPLSDDAGGKPLAQFSLALWVQPAGGTTEPQVIYQQGNAERGVAVAIDQGRFIAGLWQAGEGAWLDLGPAVPNVWQNVALVFNGSAGTLRGYVDGVEAAAATQGLPAQLEPIGTETAFGGILGAVRLDASRTLEAGQAPYRGALDEFRLYSRAIDPVEIACLALRHSPAVAQAKPAGQ